MGEVDFKEALATFEARWPVHDVIDAFANDFEQLNGLATRTYRHRNGFDRFELFPSINAAYGLRLHVWWGNNGEYRENVHGHPWDFASKVLVGQLHFEQFIEAEWGEVFEIAEYAGPNGNQTYKLNFTGNTTLYRIFRSSHLAGTNYYAGHELIHRVWTDPGQPTITLMLRGEGHAYPARVFFEPGSHRYIEGEHRREWPKVEALRAKLLQIRSLINDRPPKPDCTETVIA